jgi:leucyl-tRNA synthetase
MKPNTSGRGWLASDPDASKIGPMPERYEPQNFEAKWRQRWQDADLFKTREEEGRPKFYCLDMFPYPSGAGLSVGHCRNYIPGDVLSRMKFMQGYNVLHPMGFDAFGLPAENEAIKRKTHPAPMIEKYAANYRRQLDLVAISYDWSRGFSSCDPRYYKWTQWIFKLLYERGLAYRKLAAVNWDPVDKTVLADEEVIAGRAERSGALVEKKWIPQWFFKITDYAERLINDLDTVDWPEGIKNQQRNWIGRSEGVEFSIVIAQAGGSERAGSAYNLDEYVPKPEREMTFKVFTTRIDTVFGMTFCVLAPEHPLVEHLAAQAGDEHKQQVQAYLEQTKQKSEAERQAEDREKTGVFTGSYAINPVNGERVPIWIADYVLMGYGTGAIMAVPGHDERDFQFARKFGIDVRRVIAPAGSEEKASDEELPFVAKDGVMVNSGEYTGLTVEDGQRKLGEWMEALGIGERKVQYKLRDWLISRQRYWGTPIPIVHTKDGDMEAVPDECLPVLLPDVENYEPPGDGTSPLAQIDEFVNVTDSDGRLGRRETDTMGGFADSSWYFLRFCDPHNDEQAWDPEKAAHWMPIDVYIGGAEHAVMHLLYARFWTKVLYDAGFCPVQEPFQTYRNQGQVLAYTPYRKPREDEKLDVGEEGILISFEEAKSLPEDQVMWRWARMSKSKGNVVTPDEAVEQYGADALRMFELFVAPLEADVQWSSEGIQGQVRFLSRIFRLCEEIRPFYEPNWLNLIPFEEATERSKSIRRASHQMIGKTTDNIERFGFNTYVSALMIFVNALSELVPKPGAEVAAADALALSEAVDSLILCLSPGAPHSADELWESFGHEGFTYLEPWPTADPELAKEDLVTIAVQVNGKLRDTISLSPDAAQEEMERAALASDKVQTHVEGKTVRKVIVVPGKLVNIVAN